MNWAAAEGSDKRNLIIHLERYYMSKHIQFLDVVNSIAKSGWGKNAKDTDQLAKEMLGNPSELNAFATIELLKRFNAVARAVGDGSSREVDEIITNSNPKLLPESKVGDLLYTCDLADDGLTEYVIVGKKNNGECLIVMNKSDRFTNRTYPWIPSDDDEIYTTKHDAIIASAKLDIEYHGKRAEFARRALEACKNGSSIAEYEYGLSGNQDK